MNAKMSRNIEPSPEKIRIALRGLLKDEENRYCADCPVKGPTWASINLGVFLCLHCSGIHRSLGVHISKVRSTELDSWKLEWLQVMRKLGNTNANEYWEARLPKNYIGRPSLEDSERQTQKLKKFISDKYEKKLWVAMNNSSSERAGVTEKEHIDSGDTRKTKELESSKAGRVRVHRKHRSRNANRLEDPAFDKSSSNNAIRGKHIEAEPDLLCSFETFDEVAPSPATPNGDLIALTDNLSNFTINPPVQKRKEPINLALLYGKDKVATNNQYDPNSVSTSNGALNSGLTQMPTRNNPASRSDARFEVLDSLCEHYSNPVCPPTRGVTTPNPPHSAHPNLGQGPAFCGRSAGARSGLLEKASDRFINGDHLLTPSMPNQLSMTNASCIQAQRQTQPTYNADSDPFAGIL